MSLRARWPTYRQLPVRTVSPLGAAARAVVDAVRAVPGLEADVARRVAAWMDARHVVLTDSGTSALALAIAASTGANGVVALPGWGCPDLLTAAQAAGRRVVLYDLDPASLAPEPEALRACVARGATAVVVVHFFGLPVDIPALRSSLGGVPIIEDAAQAAGGRLRGRPLGTLGDIGVLSFGRGKGVGGAGGGALLVHAPALPSLPPLGESAAGMLGACALIAQGVIGRPWVYGVPASMPFLHLGETRYAPPHPPRRISRAAASVVGSALPRVEDIRRARAEHAARWQAVLADVAGVEWPVVADGADAGWLRLPVRLHRAVSGLERFGVVRPYLRQLTEYPECRDIIIDKPEKTVGMSDLARRLHTFPTHDLVADRDMADVADHLRRIPHVADATGAGPDQSRV